MKLSTKIILPILFISVFTQILFAELPEIITTRVRTVAPGVVQKTLRAPSKPWDIFVIEMDINDPALTVKAIDGGGLQKPSLMASAKESPTARLVAATNGDFFEPDYSSTNAGVVDGELTKLEKLSENPVYWSAMSIGENNKPSISCNKFEGSISINGDVWTIDDVNTLRSTNELVFYNHYKGSSTGTTGGSELRIHPVDGWKVNETVQCVMQSRSLNGDMSIGQDDAVLSGDGAAATFLNSHYVLGDTIELNLNMRAFEDLSTSGVSYNYLDMVRPLQHLIGGFPMFIRNGENYAIDGYRNENGGGSFATDLHPRTAAGFNEDTTKLYFVVVDGRQSQSIGIDLVDLADIMIDLGVWRAMNFDGGGSSVMIVDNDILNSPSDGYERSVRNCFAIYSSAPQEDLSIMQIELDTMRVFRGETIEFMASGWDVNYNPKELSNWSDVQLNCDPSIGELQGETGMYTLTASNMGVNGYVYIDLNGTITDSMYVQSISLDPLLIHPCEILTDTHNRVALTVSGINADGDTILVDSHILDFSVSDPSVGEIDSLGVFKGLAQGTCYIYVHYGDQVDSVHASVYIGEGEIPLDRIENLNDWSLEGENLDLNTTNIALVNRADGVNGQSAMKIEYKTTGSGKIYLHKDIPITGIPEMILLDVLSDGLNHRLYLNLEDAEGTLFTVYQSGYINNYENYVTLYMDASEIEAVYPIKVKNIYIKLKTGIQAGTLYIDDLRMTYPGNTAIHYDNSSSLISETFVLHDSYPNPFNPSTMLSYELGVNEQVKLEIFNLKGELISTLVNEYQHARAYKIEWMPEGNASACYIYKLQVANESKVGKMIFLK